MIMLTELREHLDEIEQAEPKAFEFIERLLIEWEENGEVSKLTGPQFSYLNDLHQRYCFR